MRMLNYSRDTNPFHKSRIDVPCTTKVTLPNKGFSEGYKFSDTHWIKRRFEKDTPVVNLKPRRSMLNQAHLVSSSSKRTSKSSKVEMKLESDPPTTVFASIEDMDFMDSSTLSDDVCSVLTNRSRENPFHLKGNSKPRSHTPRTRIRIVSPIPKGTETQELSVSETELVTKGKMSGMTLMDALNRRRKLVDEESVVIEHCQRPHRSIDFKRQPQEMVGELDKPLSSQKDIKEGRRDNSGDKIPDFLLARNRLKKVRSNMPKIDNHIRKSSVVSLSIDKNREGKHSQKSSNATTTTVSSYNSKSSKTHESSKYSSSQTSLPGPVAHDDISTEIDEGRDAEETLNSTGNSLERAKDDRNDVEGVLMTDAQNKNNQMQSDKNNSSTEKYNRMLKMGVPLEAVQNAMKRDLVDPSSVKLNMVKAPVEAKSSSDSFNKECNERRPPKIDFQNSHAPTNDKYLKMLKLGIPRGAVENAIQRDGGVVADVFRKGMNKPNISTKQRDPYRRTRLHWNTLKQNQLSEKSIWKAIKEDEDVGKLTIDELEFKSLFQTKELPQRRVISRELVAENAVKVIDPKRANNGGITLARLKMSYEDIAKSVKAMDISNLNAQQLSGIMEFIPSSHESKLLQDYIKDKNIDQLCECEKFMVSMLPVLDAQQKTQTMLFMLQFPAAINEIKSEILIKTKACEELTGSLRLRKILGIILKVGNRLNKAGEDTESTYSSPEANGFSVESLSKLNQVKACDKQTTVLSYIGSLIQRSNPSLLDVKDDLPHIFKAHSISSDHDKALKNLEKQLSNARSTLSTEDQDCGSSISDELPSSIHVTNFIEEATISLTATYKANEEAKRKFTHVLEYFSTEKDLSPIFLFGVVASFCKEIEAVHAELSSSKGKKKKWYIRGKNRGVQDRNGYSSQLEVMNKNNCHPNYTVARE